NRRLHAVADGELTGHRSHGHTRGPALSLARGGDRRGPGTGCRHQPGGADGRHRAVGGRPGHRPADQRITVRVLGRGRELRRVPHLHARRGGTHAHRGDWDGTGDTYARRARVAVRLARRGHGERAAWVAVVAAVVAPVARAHVGDGPAGDGP